MAPNILSPTTEEVAIKEADLLAFTLVISYRGEEFKLACVPGRINVHMCNDDALLGYVRCTSPYAGAIWQSEQCVAEYVVEQDRKYFVTEIKNFFREPSTRVEADPVLYLVSLLWDERLQLGPSPSDSGYHP